MRSRKEIMDECSPAEYAWEEDTAVHTKLILEVLLDIREYLEDIKRKT